MSPRNVFFLAQRQRTQSMTLKLFSELHPVDCLNLLSCVAKLQEGFRLANACGTNAKLTSLH